MAKNQAAMSVTTERASGTVIRPAAFADDRRLVEAIVAGAGDARAALFERYSAYIEGVLARVIGIDSDIPDLLHDVFVAALAGIDKLKDPAKLGPWLTSVAVFTARGHIRRRRRRRWLRFMAPEDLPEMDSALPDAEVRQALRATYQALDKMPTDERIPFALRVIEGMELTEVADACGVSLATIKRRLAKAESRFVALAKEHEVLVDWLESSGRWSHR